MDAVRGREPQGCGVAPGPEAGRGKPRGPRSGEGDRGSRGCWGRGGERPQPGRVRRWLMKRTAAQSERNNSTLYKKAPATRSERNNSTLYKKAPAARSKWNNSTVHKKPPLPEAPPLPQNTKTPRCQSQKKTAPPGPFFHIPVALTRNTQPLRNMRKINSTTMAPTTATRKL